jgi:hypothetical protein
MWAEIAAALVCTFFLLRKPSVFNRWFTPYLWLVVTIELSAIFLLQNEPKVKALMYNIFKVVQFVFYLSLLYHISTARPTRSFIMAGVGAVLVAAIYNLFFLQGFYVFNNYTTIVGNLVVVIACLLHFLQIGRDEWPVRIPHKTHISVLIGTISFCAGTFLLYAIYRYMIRQHSVRTGELYQAILTVLNLILYPSLALAAYFEYRENETGSLTKQST